jgi:hypothetical protein
MSAAVFLVLILLAATATVAAALFHQSRVDDTVIGPAHSSVDKVETTDRAAQRGVTPLAGRLAADVEQLRQPPQRRLVLVSGADDDGRALEVARTTGTARLARREQRLRGLGRRRALTVAEAADLAASRQVLTERGRIVPHDGLPREGVDR